MNRPFIDVHHHLIPPRYAEVLAEQGFAEVGGRATPSWSPQESLGVMDRNGIEVAITSISAPGVHFGDAKEAVALARELNDTSAELCASYPGRFGAFGVLPMPEVTASADEAVRVLDELHLDGVVLLSSNLDGSYLGDPRFDEVMAALDARGATVFVHPAIPSIATSIGVQIPVFAMEFTFDTTRAAFNLTYNGTLERYPNITWILSHAGGTVPYLVDRFELLWFSEEDLPARAPKGARGYLSKLYYDTALSANWSALSSLRQLVGDDHIVFGSDFPFAPELATMLSVDAINERLGLDEALATQIRSTNALTLFPRLEGLVS